VPDLRASSDISKDFGQMGLRIPAVVVSPYARRGHIDHSIYGFESILKMIRYRYGIGPLTPRDLYANSIAASFDWESKPDYDVPALPTPPHIMGTACSGSSPLDGLPVPVPSPPTPPVPLATRDKWRAQQPDERPKPHDLANLITSGYLERLHFKYRPATPATMFRHPSSLGMRP
jgi:phospholipase C